MALPSGFAVFSGLAVCAPDGRRPTRRERSALPILPRGAEFGLSLWSFLLLVGFIWNFASHFELWNRRADWDQAARPWSPDTDAVSGSTMPVSVTGGMRLGAIGNLITGVPVV